VHCYLTDLKAACASKCLCIEFFTAPKRMETAGLNLCVVIDSMQPAGFEPICQGTVAILWFTSKSFPYYFLMLCYQVIVSSFCCCRFYNSMFDTFSKSGLEYPESLNETEKYNHVGRLAVHLQKVSTVVAQSVYRLVTGSQTAPDECSSHNVMVCSYSYIE